MTDKQIIIDGERIFECVWCKYDFKESDALFILSENPNECVCSDCMTEWADNLLCDFKRKEQECERLKKLLKVRIEDLCDSCGASSMMPMPCKVYEKTLTEIKEIAKKIDPLCIYEDWKCTDLDNTVECPAKAKCPRECRNNILQKISEVEDGQ